jgi:hypothetical protein
VLLPSLTNPLVDYNFDGNVTQDYYRNSSENPRRNSSIFHRSLVQLILSLLFLARSDTSMASIPEAVTQRPASVQRPTEFRTEYHPRSQRPTLHQTFEEFGLKNNDSHENSIDTTPWKPFRTRGDHRFAEIALDAGLNKAQVEGLLTLISLVSQGKESVTLKNEAELRRMCDNAGAELTPVCRFVLQH